MRRHIQLNRDYDRPMRAIGLFVVSEIASGEPDHPSKRQFSVKKTPGAAFSFFTGEKYSSFTTVQKKSIQISFQFLIRIFKF